MQKLAIFREYDIRGIYAEDLTQENVVKIGFLLGRELQKLCLYTRGLHILQYDGA